VEPERMTACRIAEAVNRAEISAYRLVEKILDRCNHLNADLNLFVSIAGSEALKQANKVDGMVKKGLSLPLAGVPVVVKDDFCYSAKPTTYGSPAFKNFSSPFNAAAVDKILDAGAVIIGKTNLDGMSMGSTTAFSPIGPARNPWAVDLVAGSAGAAAVVSEAGLIALESDSGGALRQGASHCGVLGLRPSMGRVSRYGLNVFSSSFGQAGIIASTATDLSAVLNVISGFDYRDASTALCNSTAYQVADMTKPEQITIGWPENLIENLDSDQHNIFGQAREGIQAKGFKLVKLSINYFPEALRAYHVIACAEASSNLSRYDGIRFGQAAFAENLEELYYKSRRLTFGPEARRRSIFGTFLLSKDNFELYYRQALKVWKLVRQEFSAVLDQCDLLLLPVVKKLPHPVAEQVDFLELYEDDHFCAPVSLAGLPSVSIPAGKAEHLPLGLQLVGPPFSDELLIEAASRIMTIMALPRDQLKKEDSDGL
jgi:aspartyl-tRNA(Asn)/glutamyl-tRNA(Gln) amidotransferase subunit A